MGKRVMAATLLAVFLIFFGSFAGRLEGFLFPVVGNTEVSRVVSTQDHWSHIWGTSDKLRSCSFERIEWHMGTPSQSTLVDVEFKDASRVRTAGKFEFGPWEIQLSEDQIRTKSFARVFHRCHPFWITQTHFFP